MSHPIRVSVVIPFLDLERFLAESVESVRAQTYPHWELLLVDDGSTDGSSAIAQAYAGEDPARVRYLTHAGGENRGASASRNLGFAHATGEYFALLDGDDVWLPDKLEDQVALLRSHPDADAVYGRTLLWYSWTGEPEDRRRDALEKAGVPVDTLLRPPELLVRMLRQKAAVPATSSILIRRDAVDAVGGFEDEFRQIYTDQVFYAKLLLRSAVVLADRTWSKYRQHGKSSLNAATDLGAYHPDLPHPGRHRFLLWLETYLVEQELDGSEVWRALQGQLRLYRHPRLHLAVRRAQGLPDRGKAFFWEFVVPSAFRAGRRVLPRPVREWLWSRWLSDRL
jgi:glycosyltransferase involved in cell wall biosynthesis